MTELTLFNTLEVHPDWLFEILDKLKRNYPSVSQFATDNNIDYLDAFWFFKGNPVYQDAFKTICKALDFDCGAIQISKVILPPNERVVSSSFIK